MKKFLGRLEGFPSMLTKNLSNFCSMKRNSKLIRSKAFKERGTLNQVQALLTNSVKTWMRGLHNYF